jgi:hypothetical protein
VHTYFTHIPTGVRNSWQHKKQPVVQFRSVYAVSFVSPVEYRYTRCFFVLYRALEEEEAFQKVLDHLEICLPELLHSLNKSDCATIWKTLPATNEKCLFVFSKLKMLPVDPHYTPRLNAINATRLSLFDQMASFLANQFEKAPACEWSALHKSVDDLWNLLRLDCLEDATHADKPRELTKQLRESRPELVGLCVGLIAQTKARLCKLSVGFNEALEAWDMERLVKSLPSDDEGRDLDQLFKALNAKLPEMERLQLASADSTPHYFVSSGMCNELKELVVGLKDYHSAESMRDALRCKLVTDVNPKSVLNSVMGCQFTSDQGLTTPNKEDKVAFFARLFGQYKTLVSFVEHVTLRSLGGVHVDLMAVRAHLRTQLNDVKGGAAELASRMPLPSKDSYDRFQRLFDTMLAFQEAFEDPDLQAFAQTSHETVCSDLKAKIEGIRTEALQRFSGTEQAIHYIAGELVKLKRFAVHLSGQFASDANASIDMLLDSVSSGNKGMSHIASLCLIMCCLTSDRESGSLAQALIDEHATFEGEKLRIFNQGHTLPDDHFFLQLRVSEEVGQADVKPLEPEFLSELRKHYYAFKDKWEELVEVGLKHKLARNQEKFKVHLQSLVKRAKDNASAQEAYSNESIAELVAFLFAYWTLINSKHYGEFGGADCDDLLLMKPHCVQIISIFRLFGLDKPETETLSTLSTWTERKGVACRASNMVTGQDAPTSQSAACHVERIAPNHLLQIPTGQGKSVTLAIASAVLALLGCDVDYVSYSEYLSKRDSEAFRDVLSAFGVSSFIHFGTFSQLSEKIIEERGDIRSLVSALVGGVPARSCMRTPSGRPKVLLIDEADVFLNEEFYGNSYRPCAEIKHSTISELVEHLWLAKNDNPSFAKVKLTDEYKACLHQFQHCTDLIESAVRSMIHDLRTFEDKASNPYIVVPSKDALGYNEHDGDSVHPPF